MADHGRSLDRVRDLGRFARGQRMAMAHPANVALLAARSQRRPRVNEECAFVLLESAPPSICVRTDFFFAETFHNTFGRRVGNIQRQ
jgi:hypothetical protein